MIFLTFISFSINNFIYVRCFLKSLFMSIQLLKELIIHRPIDDLVPHRIPNTHVRMFICHLFVCVCDLINCFRGWNVCLCSVKSWFALYFQDGRDYNCLVFFKIH